MLTIAIILLSPLKYSFSIEIDISAIVLIHYSESNSHKSQTSGVENLLGLSESTGRKTLDEIFIVILMLKLSRNKKDLNDVTTAPFWFFSLRYRDQKRGRCDVIIH